MFRGSRILPTTKLAAKAATPATARLAPRRLLSSYLVTPEELAKELPKDPSIVPLCASWFMPNDPQKRTGAAVFAQGRLLKARFFDLDAVIDKDSPYPHMLPTPEDFAQAVGKLGIRKQDTLVVYDSAELGLFSAPRVGWTFKIFGHEKVHVLNNYKLWVEKGFEVEKSSPATWEETSYPIPDLDAQRVISFEELRSVVEAQKSGSGEIQILDARSEGRWSGKDNEPRPGLSSGHMPSSKSVAFTDLLDPTTKALLPKEKLLQLFEEKGVTADTPTVSSCGTGVTAAVIDLALEAAGLVPASKRKLYDGSWTEWAQRETDGAIIQKTK